MPAEAGVSLKNSNHIFFRTWRAFPTTRVIVSLNEDTVGQDTGHNPSVSTKVEEQRV